MTRRNIISWIYAMLIGTPIGIALGIVLNSAGKAVVNAGMSIPGSNYVGAVSGAFMMIYESYPLEIDVKTCAPKLIYMLYRIDTMSDDDIAMSNEELRTLQCLDRFSGIDRAPQPRPPERCDAQAKAAIPRGSFAPASVYAVGSNGVTVLTVRDFEWNVHPCANREREWARMAVDIRERLEKSKFRRLILDLRGNLGGYSDVVIDFLTELFSPYENAPIATFKYRYKQDEKLHAIRQGKFPCPDAVLIDHGTASAAEMVAGTLRAWCPRPRTVFVGETTRGKGTALSVRHGPLALTRVSFGEFFIGTGDNLVTVNGVGIVPDVLTRGGGSIVEWPREDRKSVVFWPTTLGIAQKTFYGTGDLVLDAALAVFALENKLPTTSIKTEKIVLPIKKPRKSRSSVR